MICPIRIPKRLQASAGLHLREPLREMLTRAPNEKAAMSTGPNQSDR